MSYGFKKAVDAEEFIIHQSDVFQKYIIGYHFVIVLVGVPVNKQFDVFVEIFQFDLEHSQKNTGLPVHKEPRL